MGNLVEGKLKLIPADSILMTEQTNTPGFCVVYSVSSIPTFAAKSAVYEYIFVLTFLWNRSKIKIKKGTHLHFKMITWVEE